MVATRTRLHNLQEEKIRIVDTAKVLQGDQVHKLYKEVYV
jgi:hypothetical protein